MILATTGLHDIGFDRLVRAVDEMAAGTEELVVIQRGFAEHTPRFAQYFDFISDSEMAAYLSEAQVVISHCGAGSILTTIHAGKPLVLAPRLKRFGEHIDDHQLELAETLSGWGRAVVVLELSAESLEQAITEALGLAGEVPAGGGGLQDALREWLDDLDGSRVGER